MEDLDNRQAEPVSPPNGAPPPPRDPGRSTLAGGIALPRLVTGTPSGASLRHLAVAVASDVDRSPRAIAASDVDGFESEGALIDSRRSDVDRSRDVDDASDVDRSRAERVTHAKASTTTISFADLEGETAAPAPTAPLSDESEEVPGKRLGSSGVEFDLVGRLNSRSSSTGGPGKPRESDITGRQSLNKRVLNEREDVIRTALAREPRDEKPEKMGTKSEERSAETVEQYRRAAARFKRRYAQEHRISVEAIDPFGFATWFVALRATWKSATWRFNKQAVSMAIESFPDEDAVRQAMKVIEQEANWDSEIDGPLRNSKPATRKMVTSESKAKFVDYHDFEQMDAYLRVHGRSESAVHLSHWLKAGITTGLRPHEWQHSRLVEWEVAGHPDVAYLFVVNAKSTNGRANGTVRTLNVSGFTSDAMVSIREMVRLAEEWSDGGEFSTNQYQCSNLLYRVCAKLWPRRKKTVYSLYSCRHQFVQNMRVAGKDEAEIAAMMGHNVTSTQNSHYGQRLKGWSPNNILDKPSPIAEELATVRRVENFLRDRLSLIKKANGQLPATDAEQANAV